MCKTIRKIWGITLCSISCLMLYQTDTVLLIILGIFLFFIGLCVMFEALEPIVNRLIQVSCVIILASTIIIIGVNERKNEPVIRMYGSVSGDSVYAVIDALESFPEKYRNKFFREGGYIAICDENNYLHPQGYNGSRDTYGHIAYNSDNSKALYIMIRDFGAEQTLLTMYHELGHYFDFCKDTISDSRAFISIYNEQKKLNPDILVYEQTHAYDNAEFFAEQYQIYICNTSGYLRDDYKFKCPKAQDFIKKLMN